jgi:hypothetical protein
MKSFFKRLFSRTITFNVGISNFVNVVDSDKRKENNDLFSGTITEVNFDERYLVIEDKRAKRQEEVHTVPFDDIVTIGRMKDGRLRMWIKVKED